MSSVALSPTFRTARPAEEATAYPATQMWPIRWSFYLGMIALAVGGLIALALDNIVPGTEEERGLKAWADAG